MGKRGRAPEPTRLRVMRGNPSKTPVPENEPKPVGGPAMPKYLNAEAKKIWAEVVPALEAVGIATTIDAAALGRYCSLSADFRKYTRMADKGQDIMAMKNGYESPAPAATLRLKIAPQLLQMEKEFGMTASSRSGLSIQDKKSDPLGDFLKEA